MEGAKRYIASAAAWGALVLAAALPSGAHAAGPVGLARRTVRGIPTEVVTVNLRDPSVHVSLGLAHNGLGRAESMQAHVARVRPVVSATGTYFDTRTLLPVGDLVVDGRHVHRGWVGTALAFHPERGGEVLRRATDGRYPGYRSVLVAGPRLLAEGRLVVDPPSEGFRDPSLGGRRRRLAAGITRAGKLLLVYPLRPVTLSELGKITGDLGAVDALNLDGGTSAALYYRGRVLARPGRALTNFLDVFLVAPRPSASPVVAAVLRGVYTTPAWERLASAGRTALAAREAPPGWRVARAPAPTRRVMGAGSSRPAPRLVVWERDRGWPAWRREES